MKVLLLNPPFRIKQENGWEKFFVRAGSRWPYSEFKKRLEPSIYRPFPFSLAYLAGILKDKYHVEVIDGVALQSEMGDFAKLALGKAPDFVVVEIAPFSIATDLNLVREIKKNNPAAIAVAVGPFVPLLLADLNQTGFDFAVNGEYELAVSVLLENMRNGKPIALKGIIELNAPEEILRKENEYTDLIATLDSLPLPHRDIFPSNERPGMNAYWDVFCQLRPAVQMQTSRGCPYRCYFCLWNQVMYHCGKYRVFSTARVVAEMKLLAESYGAKEIYIDDDDFTIDKNRVLDICDKIKQSAIRIKWSCMGDAINLDEAVIRAMASAGCIGIKFGVESANADVLREIGKPVNLTRVNDVVKWCKKYGIRTHATFTFGLLHETAYSMRQTLDFAKNLDTDSVQFSIATPYPGTIFYDKLARNQFLSEFDWMSYDGSSRAVVHYPQLSSVAIEGFYQRAFKEWIRHKAVNFAWVIRQLKILHRTFSSQSFSYNLRFIKRLCQKFFP